MKNLVICEKPKQAGDIAKVFQAKRKKSAGFYENDDLIISWMYGHILTLAEPHDYNERYKKWDLQLLPILPDKTKFKVNDNAKDQFSILKKLMLSDSIKTIYCATDPDREGELIFRELYNHIRCKKPVKRVWLKSLTDSGITSAFDEAKDNKEYDSLYYDSFSGSIADWYVGINCTRAFTLLFNQINGGNEGVYSIGRVQTPTLSMIVQREKDILSFTSNTYYTITAQFRKGDITFEATYFEDLPITNKEYAEQIKSQLVDKMVFAENIEITEKRERPPLLFNLDDLRTECSSNFNLTAAQTSEITQFLYERQYISYPRTDSNYLSTKDESLLPEILDSLSSRYLQVNEIINNGYRMQPAFIDDNKVTGHSALIPTEKVLTESLKPNYFNVYDLISRRFLSSFYPDYIYSSLNVVLNIDGVELSGRFLVHATQTKEPGWRKLYNSQSEGNSNILELFDSIRNIMDFNQNGGLPENSVYQNEFECTSIQVKECKTRPKSRFTDGSLIELMKTCGKLVEDPEARAAMKGIGTPATRDAIIERLISVGYVQRIGKVLHPTPKGFFLIDNMTSDTLKSPDLTGEWEKRRACIETENDMELFLNDVRQFVYDLTKHVKSEAGITDEPIPEIIDSDEPDIEPGSHDTNQSNNSINISRPKVQKERVLNLKKLDDLRSKNKEIKIMKKDDLKDSISKALQKIKKS
ncbi:MAG: DNA topoisomerase 3 [Firmicutes bacterium ADurb.Bin419]|nr:MAG: DNA topoisomerase 3 [Firmicutes bacterium ADurb.Bin419]